MGQSIRVALFRFLEKAQQEAPGLRPPWLCQKKVFRLKETLCCCPNGQNLLVGHSPDGANTMATSTRKKVQASKPVRKAQRTATERQAAAKLVRRHAGRSLADSDGLVRPKVNQTGKASRFLAAQREGA